MRTFETIEPEPNLLSQFPDLEATAAVLIFEKCPRRHPLDGILSLSRDAVVSVLGQNEITPDRSAWHSMWHHTMFD